MKNTKSVPERLEKLPIQLDGFSMDRKKIFDEINYFREYAEANYFRPYSTWSIYETIGHMDDPVPTTAKWLVYKDHWGEEEVSMPLYDNITWGALWDVADELIVKSGDQHHVFIEDFEEVGDELLLWTGS